ncbi:MAG TPA: hypothetical protein VMJ10_30175 [Kofleriaceae bacterium]|nr:hypothetical protein [Kofleriaceae bacterium]
MSELAFNVNGEPFEIPAGAVAWRVRKMKAKGAPEVAYGRNGQPLMLPIEADLDDLRAEVNAPGKYRLDPIDVANKPCEGAPAGYVYVHELAPSIEQQSAVPGVPALRPLPPASDSVVIEAMRMNAEIARLVVDKFPQVVEASAVLLRAADGAGLPAREPRADEDEDDEDDDDDASETSAPSGFDVINSLVAQIVPVIVTSLAGKKLPSVAEMLDWRKASPKAAKPTTEPAPAQKAAPAATQTAATEIPPLDPATMAKVVAIQAALAPEEAARARQLAAELSPAELRAWFEELSALSVPDAIAKIRSLIGGAS